MRSQLQLVMIIVLAMSTGVLGTLLAQSRPAVAQQTLPQYSECFSATTYSFDGAAMPSERRGWAPPHTIRIPPGWHPIGGVGLATNAGVVLCR